MYSQHQWLNYCTFSMQSLWVLAICGHLIIYHNTRTEKSAFFPHSMLHVSTVHNMGQSYWGFTCHHHWLITEVCQRKFLLYWMLEEEYIILNAGFAWTYVLPVYNKVGYINFQYFLNVLLCLCTSNILFSIKLFS